MPQPKIYLFAETPRAGLHHHITLLPQHNEVPDGIGERLSAVREKSSYVGNDFVGVSQEALQADTGRMGRETLVVAVPGYDISNADTRRIIDKLKELQPKLALLVTDTIDWTKEHPAGSLQRPELDVWQQELARLFPNNLPMLPTTKGNWFMRHKLFCIVTVLIVAVAVFKAICGQGLENLETPNINIRNEIVKWFPISPKPENPQITTLQSWLKELNSPDAAQTNESKLKEALKKYLSPAFVKEEPDLRMLLHNLQICFGLPDKRENPSLDDLLQNTTLMDKVVELYKNGEFVPLALVDDKDKKTPWWRSPQSKNSVSPLLTENRHFFLVAIDVQRTTQHESFQAENQDQWIHFAKQLSFMEVGKDVSAPLKGTVEMEPQFVTETDIAVAKQIFAWLTGDDANTVLKEDSPNNYNEAIQRFADWEIDKTVTKKLLVDDDLKPIPEKDSLKAALENLQKAARALPKPAK